jgi:hypothetical protein
LVGRDADEVIQLRATGATALLHPVSVHHQPDALHFPETVVILARRHTVSLRGFLKNHCAFFYTAGGVANGRFGGRWTRNDCGDTNGSEHHDVHLPITRMASLSARWGDCVDRHVIVDGHFSQVDALAQKRVTGTWGDTQPTAFEKRVCVAVRLGRSRVANNPHKPCWE